MSIGRQEFNWLVRTNLVDQVDDGALLELGLALAKLLKGNEARVGVAKNTMTVSNECQGVVRNDAIDSRGRLSLPRNNLTALQSLPKVVTNILVGDVSADLLLHGQLPPEHFLVRQTARLSVGFIHEDCMQDIPVKRTSKSKERSRVGQIGVRER